jgi:hypothetical protein
VRSVGASLGASSGSASRGSGSTPGSDNSAGSIITLSELCEDLGNSINDVDYGSK